MTVVLIFKNGLNFPGWREVGHGRGAGPAALGPAAGAPTTLSTLGLPAEVHLPQQGDCGHQLLLVQAGSKWCSPRPPGGCPRGGTGRGAPRAQLRPSSAAPPALLVPQQGVLLHAATDRGAVLPGRARCCGHPAHLDPPRPQATGECCLHP